MQEENYINQNLDWTAKKELCQLWKNTPGITKSAFCKQKGIPVSSFCGWYRKLWPKINYPKNKKIKKSNWIPVTIVPEENKQGILKTANLELSLPNNVVVKLNIEIKEVFNLIKELICHK